MWNSDPGRKYTVPWQWGSTGILLNTKFYKGDPNTSAIFLDPPDELKGKINVVPEMVDVMNLAIMYVGGEPCTADKEVLKKVRDKLMAAKPQLDVHRLCQPGEIRQGGHRGRRQLERLVIPGPPPEPDARLWLPEGRLSAVHGQRGRPEGCQKRRECQAVPELHHGPENAALISAFARYANGIKGSEAFLPEDMKTAPEIVIPAEFVDKGKFNLTCPPEVTEIYTRIWTELQK